MPLFEFDAGHLVPAQVGHAVADPVEPAVLDAVRAQVLEILRLPVFPVTWQDDDGAPRVTAMDPSGHVVSIEVLDLLDAKALVAALGRAGRSAEQGWIDVARTYPSGVGGFRRDWNAFRESQPVGTTVNARVHVVAARIDDDARHALDALAGAGVVVHELAVRAMSSGRLFLDVTEVSVPVAPLPWLLPGRPTPALEQALSEDRPAAASALPGLGDTESAGKHESPHRAGAGDHAATEPAGEHVATEPARDHAATRPVEAAEPAAPDGDLLSISASIGAPTPLVWVRNGHRREATLQPDGWIVVGDTPFAAPEAAATAVTGGPAVADAWSAWRFGEDGPSLHEAREELRAHRAQSRRRAAGSSGLRRRDRRRRAASE